MAAQTIPTQFTGSRSFIGLATETAFADGSAATDYWEIDGDDSLESDPGNIPVETIRNTRSAVSHFIQGPTWIEGSIAGPFMGNQGVRLLAAALGSDTTTGSGAPYTHALTCREDGIPSLAIEKGGSTVNPAGTPVVLDSLQYAGCLVDTLKMTGAVGAPIKVEYKVIGAFESEIAPTTPSWVTDAPFALGDVTTFTAWAVTHADMIVTAFEWELANAVKREHGYVGSRTPALIYAGERKFTGKLTVLVMDWTWVDKAVAGTAGDIIIGMVQGSFPTATFTIKNAVFGKPSKPVKIGTQRVIVLPFTAQHAVGANPEIAASILNSKSTAYV